LDRLLFSILLLAWTFGAPFCIFLFQIAIDPRLLAGWSLPITFFGIYLVWFFRFTIVWISGIALIAYAYLGEKKKKN